MSINIKDRMTAVVEHLNKNGIKDIHFHIKPESPENWGDHYAIACGFDDYDGPGAWDDLGEYGSFDRGQLIYDLKEYLKSQFDEPDILVKYYDGSGEVEVYRETKRGHLVRDDDGTIYIIVDYHRAASLTAIVETKSIEQWNTVQAELDPTLVEQLQRRLDDIPPEEPPAPSPILRKEDMTYLVGPSGMDLKSYVDVLRTSSDVSKNLEEVRMAILNGASAGDLEILLSYALTIGQYTTMKSGARAHTNDPQIPW